MRHTRSRGRVILLFVVLMAAGVLVARELAGQSRSAVQAPYFEVDPFWPKPLPDHWVLGSSIGVSVDERDHVWMIHLQVGKANARMGQIRDGKPTCIGGSNDTQAFERVAKICRRTGSSTSAIAGTTGCRCSRRTARS